MTTVFFYVFLCFQVENALKTDRSQLIRHRLRGRTLSDKLAKYKYKRSLNLQNNLINK